MILVVILIYFSVQSLNKIWWYFTEIRRYNDFQYGRHLPSWIFKFWKCFHSTVRPRPITRRFCNLIQNFAKKLDNSLPRLPSYSQKRSFPVWRPSAILSLKIWILVKTFYNGNYLTQLTKIFIIIGSFSLRYADFHISSRPPSCICIDVIILYPVTDFVVPTLS